MMPSFDDNSSVEKTTNLLNYACANRKQLFEKEVRIAPSSLKIIINRHDNEYFKNAEQLINCINKRDDIQSDNNEILKFSEDILQQQTKSYDSFKKSAATLRNFSTSFANYRNDSCE